MRTALKVVGWMAASGVALCVCTLAVLIGVNWNDELPSAAALRLAHIHETQPAVPDEENGFVFLMGFESGLDRDPRAVGMERISWINNAVARSSGYILDEPRRSHPANPAIRSKSVQSLIAACGGPDRTCVDLIRRQDPAIKEWVANEGWLLERYQQLIAHPSWVESIPFDMRSPLPTYQQALHGQQQLLLTTATLYAAGDYEAGAALLAEDLRFWRMVLASSRMLINKAIATAAIERHFKLGSVVVAVAAPERMHEAAPSAWHKPLSDEERSMLRCAAGEFTYLHNAMMLIETQKAEGWSEHLPAAITSKLFQPVATSNQVAAQYLEAAQISHVPVAELDNVLAAKRAQAVKARGWSLYNPVGRSLVGQDALFLATHAARVNDLEGVRRAALAVLQLRESGDGPTDASTFIPASVHRDPYNDAPFEWDVRTGSVVFGGLQPGDGGFHRIYY